MMSLDILRNSKMLGLGCSTFGGSNSDTDAIRALNYAYDQGIIYFDVARSYGYGKAESIVGNFALNKREKIFIASKFGIYPPSDFLLRKALFAGVRAVKKTLPSIQRSVQLMSKRTLTKPDFSPKMTEDSLDKSLKELKTSYLDLFLFHESGLEGILREDIIYTLEKAKEKGKIRSWGGNFSNSKDAFIALEMNKELETIQVAFSMDNHYSQLATHKTQRIQIIYSVLNYINNINNIKINEIVLRIKNEIPQFHLVKNIREILFVLAFNELSYGIILLSMNKFDHINRNILLSKYCILTLKQIKSIQLIMKEYLGVNAISKSAFN